MYSAGLTRRGANSGGGVSDGLKCEHSSLEPTNRSCGGWSVGTEFATVYCRQDAAQQVSGFATLNPIERHWPIVPLMVVPADLNSPRHTDKAVLDDPSTRSRCLL